MPTFLYLHWFVDLYPQYFPSNFKLSFAATKFTKPLTETEATQKETVTLTCEISHDKGVVKWLKDGKDLPDSPRYKTTSKGKIRSLVIEDVKLDEEGEYTCVIGDNKSTAGLFVERKWCPLFFEAIGCEWKRHLQKLCTY